MEKTFEHTPVPDSLHAHGIDTASVRKEILELVHRIYVVAAVRVREMLGIGLGRVVGEDEHGNIFV